MKKTGYVIAKNKGLNEFFTSSSAYDRPRWVSLEEATTYPTAELAERASTKLYKSSGSYEARAVSVTSLMEGRGRDMSYTEQPYDDSDERGIMPDGAVGDTTDSGMTAQKQGSDPSIDPEADDEMGLADEDHLDDEEDQTDIEGMVDRELGNDTETSAGMPGDDDGTVGMPGEDDTVDAPDVGFDDTDVNFGPDENEENAQLRPEEVRMMDRRRGVSESADKTVADPHEDKIKVPSTVKSALKTVIAEFDRTAKFANTRDDAKASFCMTVVEAFQELLDLLELGTVESMKLAQIHMASLMNPISSHLPPEVVKFVLSGGRKPSLKDLFDSKRETLKGL